MRGSKFVLLAAAAIVGASGVAMSAVQADDPYIWLEEVKSPRVDAWIAAHNAPTFKELEADGILIRTVTPTTPVLVQYEPTDYGRDLLRALEPLTHLTHKK